MRQASHRTLRKLVVTIAAVLLVPVAANAPARAEPAFGPTAFTGTAILPDGVTVAPAAVVDLSLAGGAAFARAVSGPDGTFALDIPETGELVALALAGGGQVSVDWLLSKLFSRDQAQPGRGLAYEETPTPQVGGLPAVDPGGGVIVPNPRAVYARETGQLVLTLVNEAAGRVAGLLDARGDLEFHLPDAQYGQIVGKVADIAHAAGVYQDPDMLQGYEDLDDPDVVPPLLAELETSTITDGDLYNSLIPMSNPPRAMNQTQCEPAETWHVPRLGSNEHRVGTKTDATLQLRRCDNDDPKEDYWAWAWDGAATDADTEDKDYLIWRYKLRTQLVSNNKDEDGDPNPYDFSNYHWTDTSPSKDVSGDGSYTVTWQVGFDKGLLLAASGQYDVVKAKKTHPWQDRAEWHKIYHVSWISNSRSGSGGSWFENGGGMAFNVPQGEPQHRVRTASHRYDVWRCWTFKTPPSPPASDTCDSKK